MKIPGSHITWYFSHYNLRILQGLFVVVIANMNYKFQGVGGHWLHAFLPSLLEIRPLFWNVAMQGRYKQINN
jgi:hypothetical protein